MTASNFGLSDIEFDLTLKDASKQSSNVDDCPVTKTKNIVLQLKDANFVGKIKFEFKKWTTKALGTLKLEVTHDGGTDTITGNTEFTQEFDLSSYTGVYKVELTSTDVSNQAGIAKITFSHIVAETPVEKTAAYTLDCSKETGSNSNYAGNGDVTVDGITWNVEGNSTTKPWRLGGKSLSKVDKSITSKTALTYNIDKIVINFGACTATVYSATLYVYDSNPTSGSPSPIATKTITHTANGSFTVENDTGKDWTNCYYRVTFNVTTGSSNQYVTISTMEFWAKEA